MSNVYINLEIRTPRKPGTPGITLERWQIGKKVPLSLAQMTVSVFEKLFAAYDEFGDIVTLSKEIDLLQQYFNGLSLTENKVEEE